MRCIPAIAALASLLLCGCASGTGMKWYAPGTWFSHAPAGAVDRAHASEDTARQAAIRQAQSSAHETQLALAAAPLSRPVAAAADATAQTVALLDQAAGPLDAGTLARLRAQVSALLSDNDSIRQAAEEARTRDRATVAEVSARLARAEEATEQAGAKLRAAFERENALANQLRSERALLWIAAGVALLLAVAYAYARFALGGVPGAIGKGLAALRARDATAGAAATEIFDSFLNRHEQDLIARAAR